MRNRSNAPTDRSVATGTEVGQTCSEARFTNRTPVRLNWWQGPEVDLSETEFCSLISTRSRIARPTIFRREMGNGSSRLDSRVESDQQTPAIAGVCWFHWFGAGL